MPKVSEMKSHELEVYNLLQRSLDKKLQKHGFDNWLQSILPRTNHLYLSHQKRQFDHLVQRHHHPVRGHCQDLHQHRYESDSSCGSCAWILSNSLLNKTFPIQQSETVPIPYGDHVRKQSDRDIELYRFAKCTEASGSDEQAVASRLFTHRGLLMIVTEFTNRLEKYLFR
ncbi:hypothetical protein TNCT_290771 [Trichonephila clavata]|uniref:Uncharacterized protein n=1 Tax=Trichonephila clavata TaxID=2740835 RepID=A0A8X6HZ02_TRICU|nr:hypothetical protein TNCT_290771 [Trichonephila clavata]